MYDQQGLSLATVLTVGQPHETVTFTDLMDAVTVPRSQDRPRKRQEAVAGDRLYLPMSPIQRTRAASLAVLWSQRATRTPTYRPPIEAPSRRGMQ